MPIPIYVLVVLVVAGLAVFSAFRVLRRTVIDPFGVAHRHPTNAPRLLSFALLVAGFAGLVILASALEYLDGRRVPSEPLFALAFVCFGVCALGLTLGAAAFAQQTARVVRKRASHPAWLLASARLDITPFRASRNFAAVSLAVMIGATVQQIRVHFLELVRDDDPFYQQTFDLLDLVIAIAIVFAVAGLLVAAAEGITERRRTLAALVATGTPRATIARSVLAETLIPLVPSVLVAAVIGTLVGRAYVGADIGAFGEPTSPAVPWVELAVLCSGAVVASLVVTSAALFLLPASVSPSELRSAR